MHQLQLDARRGMEMPAVAAVLFVEVWLYVKALEVRHHVCACQLMFYVRHALTNSIVQLRSEAYFALGTIRATLALRAALIADSANAAHGGAAQRRSPATATVGCIK